MAKKAQLKMSPQTWARYLLLMILFFSGGLLVWHYDWSKFKPNFNNPDSNVGPIYPLKECPKTSCDTGNCCRSKEYDPSIGISRREVSAVLTSEKCECPSDTIDKGDRDAITPGGPYKICICPGTED